MKITFNLPYHTHWGQHLVVCGNLPQLGAGNPSAGLRLDYLPGGHWKKTIALPAGLSTLTYRYVLIDDAGQTLDEEWEQDRILDLQAFEVAELDLYDHWRPQHHPENGLDNAAFLEVIFKGQTYSPPALKRAIHAPVLQFQLYAPSIAAHQRICLLGNTPELGNWDRANPILLGNKTFPQWTVSMPVPRANLIEYKYGVYDTKKKELLFLESGPNRTLRYDLALSREWTLVSDIFFQHPGGSWKGAGLAIPVFSLRSENSFGVGAFSDIRYLVDWAVQLGMKMVQILPINDTSATFTWVDSYPYAAISVFALHPLYLDPAQLTGFDEVVDQEDYKQNQQALNQLAAVDYEAVMHWKLHFARAVFAKRKATFLKSKDFKTFLKANQHWLPAYAWFSTLRDQYGTPDFNQWGADAVFSAKGLKAATDPKGLDFDKVAFYYYLQYHLDRQLLEVSTYARQHQVVLKGDIPIGIYRYSVDAWMQPHLYHMGSQSGAPPDPFSDLGQNWGFPTYNWEEMAKNGYQWWQNRLQTLSRYFDAFRIDHILGFFRIWQIPYQQIEGTLGYFNPAIPVSRQEFLDRGIAFDRDRFCQPFISNDLLWEIFSTDAEWVADTFLENISANRFRFRPAFDTQRKVFDYFKDRKENGILKTRLFKLHSNVLFIEDPNADSQAFHPRIDMQQTQSFQQLDGPLQQQLNILYHDYFYHRQEDFWRRQAMTKLPAIKQATNMLICGEDLGMIPACVPEVMRKMDLLTLEIERMSKNPKTEFLQAVDIPYLSVCSPSTHDMSPVRLWWEESDRDQIRRFYHQELQLEGEPPATCETYVAEKIMLKNLQFPSMWAVFPVQDLLGIDAELRHPDPLAERINIPANPQHYWQYRLHLSLETLAGATDFNRHVANLLEKTGRG